MKTNAYLNAIRDADLGDVTDLEVKYIAWGTGAPSMDGTDTTLANEIGRKAVTSQVTGGTGVCQIILYLTEDEANTNITEVGFFAGAGATASADTGILTDIFYDSGYLDEKNSGHSLLLTLTNTHEEGS